MNLEVGALISGSNLGNGVSEDFRIGHFNKDVSFSVADVAVVFTFFQITLLEVIFSRNGGFAEVLTADSFDFINIETTKLDFGFTKVKSMSKVFLSD